MHFQFLIQRDELAQTDDPTVLFMFFILLITITFVELLVCLILALLISAICSEARMMRHSLLRW